MNPYSVLLYEKIICQNCFFLFLMILGIISMIHWSEPTNSKCRDKLPNGLRCRAKDICPRLAKKGLCKQKWIALKPDKKCLYNVKRQAQFKSVKKFCKKSCVCGKHDLNNYSEKQYRLKVKD